MVSLKVVIPLPPSRLLGVFDVEELMKTRVQECDGGFICMICGRRISLRGNMVRHLRDQHLSTGADYRCPPCNKYFKNRADIYNHIRTRHRDWQGVNYDNFAVKYK